jgi:hypothetical protein
MIAGNPLTADFVRPTLTYDPTGFGQVGGSAGRPLGSVIFTLSDLHASQSLLRDDVEYRPGSGTDGNDLLVVLCCQLHDVPSVTLINAAHARDQ